MTYEWQWILFSVLYLLVPQYLHFIGQDSANELAFISQS